MRTTRTAFTLIELLVVISIIAVLMSMLMTAVKLVRESASGAVCQSNERQIGIAFMTYAEDQDGRMPSGSWNDLLQPYLDESGNATGQASRIATCTAAKGASYGYTGVYYDSIARDGGTAATKHLQYPFAWVWYMPQVVIYTARICSPATKIVLSEREGVWTQNVLNDRGARRMHRQGGNFLAADGHVQTIPMTWLKVFELSGANPAAFKSDPMWRPYNPGISAYMK